MLNSEKSKVKSIMLQIVELVWDFGELEVMSTWVIELKQATELRRG